ncbi:MAG TPA: sulfatase-like hydrolase/transferase [Chthoniobacteraceae bacterium]|jgi:arylsulfatase A-like enzyme|nr:sulfatase-like hydrolase/transferase [Chthoniobacteraceae bacterium]
MRRTLCLLLFLFTTGSLLAQSTQPASGKRPNVLFILCDDLGYGDVGVFFQNARRQAGQPFEVTPHIDAMAVQGIQLLDHYSAAPVCAPARGSLMAGVTQGHAGVRNNQFDKALENNHTLATVMKQAGYATAIIGKWGMQGTNKFPVDENTPAPGPEPSTPAAWPAYPTKRGFDYFFGYVRHADGHEHYPKEGIDGRPKQVWENDHEVSAGLDKCYTTDLFTARAKQWIIDQHTAHPAQPFFMYLAYDTPHAVTELPTMPFPAGAGLHGGMQWLGKPHDMINTAGGKPDGYMDPQFANATYTGRIFGKAGLKDPDMGTHPWPQICKRYATVVKRIDYNVGDILQLLKDLHIDGDTLVIFTSDNGPSPESYLPEENHPNFFHSFGPYDGIKRDCWEGGDHMGAIARWPGVIPAGQINHTPSQFQDWMPTLADVAGVPAPARTDGVSLIPTLTGRGKQAPSTIYVEYYFQGSTPGYQEFLPAHRNRQRNQMQVLRLGDFLGVRYNIRKQSDDFEIYDIPKDPQESTNLAATMPALDQEMKTDVLQLRRPDASAPRPYDQELVPAVPAVKTVSGVDWRRYEGNFPWVPKADFMTPSESGTASGLAVPEKEGAMLFTGYINAPADGAYTFSLRSDTGALLRIHNATVIDEDFGYPAGTERDGMIRLCAGLHPFRLYYRHAGPSAPALRFQWSVNGAAPSDVPLYRTLPGFSVIAK